MKGLRKIAVMSMLLVFFAAMSVGCQKKEGNLPDDTNKVPTETVKDNQGETEVTPTDKPADGSKEDGNEVVKEGTVEKGGNVVLKQLAFIYKENTIALSDIVDDEKIESMLGKAKEIKTHTYSEDDGLNMDQLNGMTEKQYIFPGLVIKTIDASEDKKFFIHNIEITDAKYTTTRNIKVGDSFDKLKEAYPEGYLLGGELSDQEDDFRYEPVNYVDTLMFHIKDKKVESIKISTLLD